MRTAFGVCLAAVLAAPAALADGIDDMCQGAGRDAELCACARGALDRAYPAENVATYETTARHYVRTATPDAPEGDWNAALGSAVKETGLPLNEVAMISGEVGRAHQIAMRLCRPRPAPAAGDAEAETPEAGTEAPPEAESAPAAGESEAAPQAAQ